MADIKNKQRKKDSSRKRWLIPIILAVIGVVIQFTVAPIIGMRQLQNNIDAKLWIAAEDIPPSYLVYGVSEEGKLYSEYSPSFSYTLCAEQELIFQNPIIWSPSRTCYAPYDGLKLTRISQPMDIGYEKINNNSLVIWPKTKFFDKEKSSVLLLWELSGCATEKVSFESTTHDYGLRVQISNNHDFPVQYLGIVELPPIKSDTPYIIHDSPPEIHAPELIEVKTGYETVREFEVALPFIAEIDKNRIMTFDVQTLSEPPSISFTLQASTIPPSPYLLTPGFNLWVVIVIIGCVLFMMLLRGHRSRRP